MNPQGKRMAFNNARNAIKRSGQSAAHAVLSQSYLRLEVPLTTTQTQYTFDVLVNENLNPNNITQQKLNLQDAFYASEIGLYVATAASAVVSETNVKLYSYPNPQIFTTANAAASLYTLYNGFIQLTINQRTIVPNWDNERHLFVPQTQQTAAATPPIDQFEAGHQGMYPAEPAWVLSGGKKNVLQVVMPAALTAIQANSRLVLILRGVLAQNVTSVR
jgi:hypothetical protein